MAENLERFQHEMNQGHTAAWDMEWESAARHYKQALDVLPNNTQALVNLGNALYELERYDKALAYYKNAAKISPDDPLILERVSKIFEFQGKTTQSAEVAFSAAEMHLKIKDVEKTIENLLRSVQLAPENLRMRARLALIFERLGRKRQAVTQYLAVASMLQHAGKKERAIELVHHCLRLSPKNSSVQQALGLLRANQPLPLPARRYSEGDTSPKIASPQPFPQIKSSSPEMLAQEGDPVMVARKEAMARLAVFMFDQEDDSGIFAREESKGIQLLSKGTGPLSQVKAERETILLHLGKALDMQQHGQREDAGEGLERAIKSGLNIAAAHFDQGLLLFEQKQHERAIRSLQKSVNNPSYALAAQLLLGRSLGAMGLTDESSLHYLQALKLADTSMFENEQAEKLRQIYDQIIDAYSRETEDDLKQQLCNTIDNLLMQANWREQVAQARQQLPPPLPGTPPIPLAESIAHTKSTQLFEVLSNVHKMARKGHSRLAMEEAYWALQFAPTYLPLHTMMAEILLEQNRIQEAIEKLSVIARAYRSQGESDKAIEVFQRITQLAPLNLAARQSLIKQLSSSGKDEETVKEYLKLGDVYYRLAELDKARETYQKALSVTQQSTLDRGWAIQVLHRLADIYLQLLDWRRALRLYEQIYNTEPNDLKAAFNVIDLYLRTGNETRALAELGNYVSYLNSKGQSEKIIEILKDLIQNNEDQAGFRQTLGQVYSSRGMIEKAIEQFDAAREILENKGDKVGSRQVIQTIISLDPPNAQEYVEMLENL